MVSKRLVVASLAALAALGVAVPAALAIPNPAPPPIIGIQDQSTAGPSDGSFPFHFIESPAQTFTAGVSGALTNVVISLEQLHSGPGDLIMDVTAVDGLGRPDAAAVLATSDPVPTATLPSDGAADATFTFSTPAAVTAGTTYGFVIRNSDFHFWFVIVPFAESAYAGGTAFAACCHLHVFDFFPFESSFVFTTYVLPEQQVRMGYCSVAGNTSGPTGQPIAPGTFLNLSAGQPDGDANYRGAVPARYLDGLGISCDVPAGYTATGKTVGYFGDGDPGSYPFYKKTG